MDKFKEILLKIWEAPGFKPGVKALVLIAAGVVASAFGLGDFLAGLVK